MNRRAFTLVELLVVITIIGLLVALLLPAVQSARESGRRATCGNYLNQLGKACLLHDEQQGSFPSGGWGNLWVGDPSLGYGRRQPGSWLYSILPNVDQDALHKMGGSDGFNATSGNQMLAIGGAQQCISTPLPFMNCPSRRRAVLYPAAGYKAINAGAAPMLARGDYAANVGNGNDVVMNQAGPSVTGLKSTNGVAVPQGGLWLADQNWQSYYALYTNIQPPPNGTSTYGIEPNGVIYTGSQVRKDDIADGASNTLLLGEKYLNSNNYASTGTDNGDKRSMYSGCAMDNERTTIPPTPPWTNPMQDSPSILAFDIFGSAHVGICCFVFCDGSVHWIKNTIDAPTFQCLGSRNDSITIDTSKF
jgi:prepilin-type N-terminal cleavage/methylation domain-containing protein